MFYDWIAFVFLRFLVFVFVKFEANRRAGDEDCNSKAFIDFQYTVSYCKNISCTLLQGRRKFWLLTF